MEYYSICRRILGYKQFEKLIKELSSEITIKFSGEILLEEYILILEINIKVILIIAISSLLDLSNTKRNEKINIEETKKYMIAENVEKMEKKYKKYISNIKKNLEN